MTALQRRRATALAMAGLYTLLAMAGQGLHELTHALGVCSHGDHEHVAAASPSCGCHASVCPFDKQEQRRTKPSGTAFTAPDSDGHNPHTCGVCRLLAQLKVGQGLVKSEAIRSATLAGLTFSTPQRLASATLTTLGARGPPAIG